MISPEEFQEMLEKSAKSDISAMLSAKEVAKRRMVDDPSAANVSAFNRAQAILEKALTPADNPDEGPKRFSRIADVVKFLKDQGYKLGKSKLYADVKAGYLTGSETDGYTIEAVWAYVHTQMLDKAPDKGAKIDILAEKRLQKEVEKLTAQVEKLQFDLARDHGKYLPKEETRTEMALRIAAFEAAIKHLCRIHVTEWVELVKGDVSMAQSWLGSMYHHMDELLNEMANIEELNLIVTKTPEAPQ